MLAPWGEAHVYSTPVTIMADEKIPCYIARCLCGCGALKFAAVDEPNQSKEHRADNAKEIAGLLRKGYTIERMAVGEVRKANWKCSGPSISEGPLRGEP